LATNPSSLDDRCHLVAAEFGDWEDSRRRIDLLAIDKAANLVVIELKRTEDGGHMELEGALCRNGSDAHV
jgi:RecB family endonuclease NucS